MRVSVIVPVLNDAASLQAQRDTLRALTANGHEVIVVDGGSGDDSISVAQAITTSTLQTPPGRALQMNAGAKRAHGDVLLFLHADTRLGPHALDVLGEAYRNRGDGLWGRYDVRLDGNHAFYRVIETMMNLRSRLTGVATGDQAIFMTRRLFDRTGGFAEIPLMEDVALCKQLRKLGPPECLRERVLVSTRRWERHGICATTVLMWRLRLSYFLGADPARLARLYHGPGVESRS